MRVSSGKVAKIVTATEIAINRGAEHGVQEGDSAIVRRPIEVEDPDTKESIGSVSVRVLTLDVRLVLDKMCVAKVTDRAPSDAFRNLFGTQSNRLQVPPLKQVTTEPTEASDRVVCLQIGQQVTIERADPEEDEEPF
jgi:hypothetical protein